MGKGGQCCAVATCRNTALNTKNKGLQVRFFRFPKDSELKKEWTIKCRRKDVSFNPLTARICSDHFTLDDYEDAVKAQIIGEAPKRLLKHAVPSLLLVPSKPKRSRPTKHIERKDRSSIIQELLKDSQESLRLQNAEDNSLVLNPNEVPSTSFSDDDKIQILEQEILHLKESPATSHKYDEVLDVIGKRLSQPSTIADKFCDIGKAWGSKLRELDSQQAVHAEKIINDVFYEAQLGNLNRHCFVQIPQDYTRIAQLTFKSGPEAS